MTDPQDLAALVAKLRDCAECKSSEAWSRIDGGQDLCIGSALANEAADALEAQAAEIARLTHLFDLSQKTTEAVLDRAEKAEAEVEERHQLHLEQVRITNEWIARADAAEADRDKAREYAAQARIRENKAEDARVSAEVRALRAEAGEDALAEALKSMKATCGFNRQMLAALAAYEARRKG